MVQACSESFHECLAAADVELFLKPRTAIMTQLSGGTTSAFAPDQWRRHFRLAL
jgi:hypothetical protein